MKKGKGFLDILKKAYDSGIYCIVDGGKSYEGCKSKSLDENKMTVEVDGKEKTFEIDQITMRNSEGSAHYELKTERDKKEKKSKEAKPKKPLKDKESLKDKE